MRTRTPAEVFPPGDFIREELEERGWSQSDLARILGRAPSTVSKLLSGKAGITPATARELSEVFGTSAEYWLNLESVYRLNSLDDPDGQVRHRAKLFEIAPVRDMQARQWIRPTDNVAQLEQELKRFFRTDSLDRIGLPVAARASTSLVEPLNAPQLAWCHQALRMALTVTAKPFAMARCRKGLKYLRSLAVYPEEARKIPRVLGEMGIRFVVVEQLPRTRIDGAAFWIDDKSPLIAVSIRYDRIDSFWHTLAHELSHIMHRDMCSVDENMVGDGRIGTLSTAECEIRADRDAANFLIPDEAINSFISRVRPYFSKVRINQFANRHRIHPGIVVDRYGRNADRWLGSRSQLDSMEHDAMATKVEQVQRIIREYRDAGEEWPPTSKMIASWAIRTNRWDMPRRNMIDLAARDIATAMREEYATDPQGRRVRKKHAIRELRELPDGTHEQLMFWVDIEDADPEQMEKAFQLRRMQVLGDCKHLKTDVDSWNDNNKYGVHIQMEFDFSEDLAEMEQPAEYVGGSV